MPALFVYGTLRRPAGGPEADTHFHARIASGISAATSATLPGSQLYDLGAYPGIGRGETIVVGELFDVSASTLVVADEIEGHPDFYEREIETILLADGSERDAWVYWAPNSLLEDSLTVPSGDWFDRERGLVRGAAVDDQLAQDKTRVSLEKS